MSIIEQLKAEIAELKRQERGFMHAMAYVADDLIPKLAASQVPEPTRDELIREVRRVRLQFLGPRPGLAPGFVAEREETPADFDPRGYLEDRADASVTLRVGKQESRKAKRRVRKK